MVMRHRQIGFVFPQRGGKRKGAGRKRRGPRANVRHGRRADFKAAHPLHVTLRMADDVGRLRVRAVLRAVAEALRVVGNREDFRIVHTSIQDNHLHLTCEAESRQALGKGMQAFKTSAARRINRVFGRKGRVFAGRYHVEVATSPTQTRNMLCYVLNNWRKHNADRNDRSRVDPFSTGMYFRGWAERATFVIPPGVDVLPYREPRTWFLREGYKKCHRPISLFDIPSHSGF
jgi:REP element-mobilizing transposase RayT